MATSGSDVLCCRGTCPVVSPCERRRRFLQCLQCRLRVRDDGVNSSLVVRRSRRMSLFTGLDSLSTLSNANSRSISPENFTGEKGRGGMATEGTGKNAARDLGQGWKISPSVRVEAGATFTLCDIAGPGG